MHIFMRNIALKTALKRWCDMLPSPTFPRKVSVLHRWIRPSTQWIVTAFHLWNVYIPRDDECTCAGGGVTNNYSKDQGWTTSVTSLFADWLIADVSHAACLHRRQSSPCTGERVISFVIVGVEEKLRNDGHLTLILRYKLSASYNYWLILLPWHFYHRGLRADMQQVVHRGANYLVSINKYARTAASLAEKLKSSSSLI